MNLFVRPLAWVTAHLQFLQAQKGNRYRDARDREIELACEQIARQASHMVPAPKGPKGFDAHKPFEHQRHSVLAWRKP